MRLATQCLPYRIAEIPDPGSRGFLLEFNEHQLEGFVVRSGQQIYVYRNRCPHTGVSLDWAESGFLSYDQQLIQCAMHGALFSIEEGVCLWGPCVGDRLEKLDFETDKDGRIYIDCTDQ